MKSLMFELINPRWQKFSVQAHTFRDMFGVTVQNSIGHCKLHKITCLQEALILLLFQAAHGLWPTNAMLNCWNTFLSVFIGVPGMCHPIKSLNLP